MTTNPPLHVFKVLDALALVGEPKPQTKGFYWRWRTRMDEKVCPICQPLNGRIWKQFEEQELRPIKDTHPNCRCLLEHEHWEFEDGQPVELS